MLCDSVVEHVHGAAIHGTMLYEDGRNGDSPPVFRDITIENITAHGGDYGIFLEAFPEVPITGLVLRNITIDGVYQCLRSMNWQDAVVENVTINGKALPRPDRVRVLGCPVRAAQWPLRQSAVGLLSRSGFTGAAARTASLGGAAARAKRSPCLRTHALCRWRPLIRQGRVHSAAATRCCSSRLSPRRPGCAAAGC